MIKILEIILGIALLPVMIFIIFAAMAGEWLNFTYAFVATFVIGGLLRALITIENMQTDISNLKSEIAQLKGTASNAPTNQQTENADQN